MLKVHVFPADKAGCGLYRMREPARVVAAAGLAEVTVCDSVPVRFEADVVVVQRPTLPHVLPFIDACRDAGMAIVVELDDMLHELPAGHPFLKSEHDPQVALDAAERADMVTVTTPALAERYTTHNRVRILPNMLPADRVAAARAFRVARPHTERATVGYAGPYSFHAWDFEVVGNGVAKAQRALGFPVHVISDEGDRVLRALRLTGSHGWWRNVADLGPTGYTAGLAGFDVGLVPLAANAFNHAKSDLKGLEYAACGVPFVASPTEPYLMSPATSAVARDRNDWRDLVSMMVADVDHRRAECVRLLDYAATRTYEGNASLWFDAWLEARDVRVSA